MIESLSLLLSSSSSPPSRRCRCWRCNLKNSFQMLEVRSFKVTALQNKTKIICFPPQSILLSYLRRSLLCLLRYRERVSFLRVLDVQPRYVPNLLSVLLVYMCVCMFGCVSIRCYIGFVALLRWFHFIPNSICNCVLILLFIRCATSRIGHLLFIYFIISNQIQFNSIRIPKIVCALPSSKNWSLL